MTILSYFVEVFFCDDGCVENVLVSEYFLLAL